MTTANLALKRDSGPANTESRESRTITIETSRFGSLDVDAELVIEMADGLIGFEHCRQFVVVTQDEGSPFRWFQCLDDGSVAFPIIDPWQFKPDYAPTISDGDARRLGLSPDAPRLIFAVVTVPKHDPRAMTANLLGPLVINTNTRQGRQVIVADEQYGTRHSIMEEMEFSRGKTQDASGK